MRRTHHVGGEGRHRVAVGLAHQRLRRHVYDDFGGGLSHGSAQGRAIAHIADNGTGVLCQQREQIRISVRCERVAGDGCTQLPQPQGKPRTFESGVAR